MEKEQFLELSVSEQNWLIFDAVTNDEGKGIGGLFGPDRPPVVQPKQPKIDTPPGFTDIFGPEPDKSDSAHRVNWIDALSKFAGLIPIELDPAYEDKKKLAEQRGLGRPIAYSFGIQDRICFANKPNFFRPFSWYTDAYNVLLDAARNG